MFTVPGGGGTTVGLGVSEVVGIKVVSGTLELSVSVDVGSMGVSGGKGVVSEGVTIRTKHNKLNDK